MARRITRRRFLQSSTAATATTALVGPGLVRAKSPNETLNFAIVGVGGRGKNHLPWAGAENIVAMCDVDTAHLGEAAIQFPRASLYVDYRVMFDKHHKEIDAVVVATPDHSHAPASMMAIKHGKHVYCEKPLTQSVHEARALAEAARRYKVATQLGNQGHSNEGNRILVEWIRAGAIGDVTEIHTWTNRPAWSQGYAQRPETKPVPKTLAWDLWLGATPYRDYHDNLHPFAWRGSYDFGTGSIGDMGCHTWDAPFWAMDPDYPTTVEPVKMEGHNNESYPNRVILKWAFPEKGNRPAYDAYWYSGGWKPPVPDEILTDPQRDNKELPGSGSLYIGTKGKIVVAGDYGESPRLIPESAMTSFERPPKTIPRSPGHHVEFVRACKGGPPAASNFDYGGPLTEAMLLGTVAIKVGGKIECDPVQRYVRTPEAQPFVRREYRKGWKL